MDLWTKVQQHTADHRIGCKTRSRKTQRGPLDGKLYDTAGERLVTVYAKKKDRRYRYYISVSLHDGIKTDVQHGWRLPGQEIDHLVENAISAMLHDQNLITTGLQQSDVAAADWSHIIQALGQMGASQVVETLLQCVTLYDDQIQLQLSLAPLVAPDIEAPIILHTIPIKMKRRGVEMRLIIANGNTLRKDPNLIKIIARAHV